MAITLGIGNPLSLGNLLGKPKVSFRQRMDLHRKNSSSVAQDDFKYKRHEPAGGRQGAWVTGGR